MWNSKRPFAISPLYFRSVPVLRALYRSQLNWRTFVSLGWQSDVWFALAIRCTLPQFLYNEYGSTFFSYFFFFLSISDFLPSIPLPVLYASISDFRICPPPPIWFNIYSAVIARDLTLNTKTIHLFFFCFYLISVSLLSVSAYGVKVYTSQIVTRVSLF